MYIITQVEKYSAQFKCVYCHKLVEYKNESLISILIKFRNIRNVFSFSTNDIDEKN